MNSANKNEKVKQKRNFVSLGTTLLDIDTIDYIFIGDAFRGFKVLARQKIQNPTISEGIELFESKKQELALQYLKLAQQLIENPKDSEVRQKLDAFVTENARNVDAANEAEEAERRKRRSAAMDNCRKRAAEAFPGDILRQDEYILKNNPCKGEDMCFEF